MTLKSQASLPRLRFSRRSLLITGVLCAGVAAVAGWTTLDRTGDARSAAKASAPITSDEQARGMEQSVARTVPPKRVDPRFANMLPPKLAAVKSPEAERMIADMQSAYRCSHSGSQRGLPSLIPGAEGAELSLEEMAGGLRQALSIMPDACYVNAALPQLANPRTPGALLGVLYEDLVKRPDPIKLRALFVVAGIDGHPLAAQALSDLQGNMNTDLEREWPRWEQAISQQLARADRGTRGASCRVH